MVLRSTFRYDSIHGSTKKIPGPLDPPCRRRPSRNITALSYSCTTLKQTQREKGSVTRTRPHEIIVRSRPHRPTPLSDSSALPSDLLTSLAFMLRQSLVLARNFHLNLF